MRISDWSSDVCSSDLAAYAVPQDQAACAARRLRGAAGGAVPAMTASVEGPMTAATINPDEAAHFGRLAADWWNPYGESESGRAHVGTTVTNAQLVIRSRLNKKKKNITT